jgi:hypothetical protein
MSGTYTLPCLAPSSVTKKKSFITLTYVACTLNLLQSYFTIVATVAVVKKETSWSVNDAYRSVIDGSRVMLQIAVSLMMIVTYNHHLRL